ncbi:mRNA turnover protein 4 homolog [Neocloeon triangulifer]|uniref:mRNA turnover protein 4 homolog n=1 Tax=Neocloeon triangulifer TaxID=2078957 RepID=UPI00286F4590|nr:mRNA turnover protein 4 homolog [Neocloeon triangulifer]
MPKSKRDKKISLTRTTKKGQPLKKQLVDDIRKCLESYARIFVFSVHNMRNIKLKEVRDEWKQSRFFLGKNKVMAIALGRTAEEESQPNIHHLANTIQGQCGILFTNKKKDEVIEWFEKYSEKDFARSGGVATRTVNLEAGPLDQFTHSMEPQLRQLGMPTSLKKGVVTLTKDYAVCKTGDILNPEQARILKLLGEQMAEFKFTLRALWSNDGTFEKLCDAVDLDPTDVPLPSDDEDLDDEN